MNNYENIPLELRQLDQWVVWKDNKVPYDAKTGQKASVNDKNTWSTFNEVLSICNNYNGIGFVFIEENNLTFMDLDNPKDDQLIIDRQKKIATAFDSYSEVSPSGTGLHIIVKGLIPKSEDGLRHGLKRASVEIYSDRRFATFTGNVYNNKPITDHSDLIVKLWEEMSNVNNIKIDNISKYEEKEKLSDDKIIDMAINAVNGNKFDQLRLGNWKEFYNSQSEADFSFVNMLQFYTKNIEQIIRIFQASELGKRQKAKRKDYITQMIKKSFDKEIPLIEFDLNGHDFRAAVSSKGKTSDFDSDNLGLIPNTASTIPIPPGLMGRLAQSIYQMAPRPVPEIALAGAIGFMSGVCGRAYNISGTGLNQYVLLIAPTGSGKEACALGIDKLINEIRFQVPTSVGFIGPSEIASGQALVKYLSKSSQCFVSILGEFGLRLQQMSSLRANSAEISLRRMLLDLYNKSGHGQVARPSIYADQDKNTATIQSPSFSILGESTPERFYSTLSEEMISEGLLPRFMLIEYNGPRPALSINHLCYKPSDDLLRDLSALIANVEIIMHNKNVINVNASNEAQAMFDDFDKYADQQINGTNKEVLRQLWNRAHIKSLKLSALIAVGVNMSEPLILPEYVTWAINMVQFDIRALSRKWELGEIGEKTNETGQITVLKKLIKDYYTIGLGEGKSYDKFRNYHLHNIICHSYISVRLSQYPQFYKDQKGRTKTIKQAIGVLVECGILGKVSPAQFTSNSLSYIEGYHLIDQTLLME